MAMDVLTKELLVNYISYDPTSGQFYRVSNGKRADTSMKIGYRRVRVTINGRKHELLAHRVAWLMTHNAWPKNEIDHIDGQRDNNLITNLRHVTRLENARNIKLRSDNTSGIYGVNRHQNGWKVRIGKEYVGYYGCFGNAISSRKSAQNSNGYHANHGRTA